MKIENSEEVVVIKVPYGKITPEEMNRVRKQAEARFGEGNVIVMTDIFTIEKMNLKSLEIIGKRILKFVDLKREKGLTSSEQ